MIPIGAKAELIQRRQAGESWTALAQWLTDEYGIEAHRTTIQRWYDREGILLDLASPPTSDSLDDDEGLEADFISRQIKADKKIATQKSEGALYKKLYENLLKESAKTDTLINAMAELTPAFKGVTPVQARRPQGRVQATTGQTVVAPLTDTHIGEIVDFEQMAGLNSYDFDIFNKRLYGWATQLLALVELRRNSAPIDELVIPMLGDMISGDIHEELSSTNAVNVMEQMIRGANLIAQAVMYLAPHFKKVRIPCVVGNHGRLTRKPANKDKYVDWDYMLYQWVASFCKNQKNIEFDIPKSFVNMFNVADRNILILHGDSGGGGSWTSISKVLTSLRNVMQYRRGLEKEAIEIYDHLPNKAGLPTQFDSVLMGHFHRCDEIDIGTGQALICGCMKGGDEFALNRLQVISKPAQIVTYWHPKYGFIGKEIIYLNRYDSSDKSFNDVLPNVWTNNHV